MAKNILNKIHNSEVSSGLVYLILFVTISVLLLPPFYIIFAPLLYAYDWFIPGNILEGGVHVDWFFIGAMIITWQGWLYFTVFFTLIGVAVWSLRYLTSRGRQLEWLFGVVITFILAFSIRMILIANGVSY